MYTLAVKQEKINNITIDRYIVDVAGFPRFVRQYNYINAKSISFYYSDVPQSEVSTAKELVAQFVITKLKTNI